MRQIINILATLIVAVILGLSLAIIAGIASKWARAEEAPSVSIYDSPSDKTKVVIEVCLSKCAKLITDKKTLSEDYDKIQEWTLKVAGELE